MEHFVVSALKYRPTTFQSVVGQEAITKTLENAIAGNHLAQALLFTGPRGVGKTTCARILAKKINQVTTGSQDEDFAFNIFELDAASNNSVDDIRNLTDQVRIPPQTGKYKVYIIDEVHMLSQAAFNAFLKTLEEPPKHAIFILATTEKHKIIPTILSRCQIFDFKRITLKDIKDHLAEIAKSQGIEAEDDALHIIAQKADGALRDALSIFDRVVSFSGKNLTRVAVAENLNVLDYTTYFETTDLLLKQDIPGMLIFFDTILSKGFDGHHFISGLASHFRDLLVSQHPETIALLEVGTQIKSNYQTQANAVSKQFLLEAIELANSCDLKYKTAKNQRLLIEICLMQLCSLGNDGEKKKSRKYIIPPNSSTGSQKTVNKEKDEPQPEKVLEKPVEQIEIQKNNEPDISSEPILPIQKEEKRISAFSLKSIEKKKEISQQASSIANQNNKDANQAFSLEELQAAWISYSKLIENKGEYIIASHLNMCLPSVKGNVIEVEYPNNTIKVEMERSQQELLDFLSMQLKNDFLELKIVVNESSQKQYAYTTREKFEILKEKNPLMEVFRKTFDLDI